MLSLLLLIAAQTSADGQPDVIQQLFDCRAIANDGARLACYDRTAKTADAARQQKDFVVLDKREVQKAKRSMFGFSLPSIKLFGDGKNDEALKQLVGTLQSSTPLPGGLMRFALNEGGIWETTEQSMARFRQGDTVTITAGSLGSYIATAPGRRSVRVRRLR